MAKKAAKTAKQATLKRGAKPALLSGGNPQIAKGYGDEPVKAYIAAVPDWRRDVCAKVDALVVRAVPNVQKAVKYNSPLYGVEPPLWFMSLHVFAAYVKVAFFRGAELKPPPQGASKQKFVRYLDIREGDEIDEKQFMSWVKQASKLPGEKL